MLVNRLYYHLKPYLPWRLRMALRRAVAQSRRELFKDVWPINESAARPPDGWPGWPNGKKFAVVLTHDVEGPDGLAKCLKLMQLEKDLGFRSSFNFIPEGDYVVSRETRDALAQNDFEVGVHDFHHDGKLYWSRQAFSESAREINRYLKEWGAAGFRSGFMLRNLDWLHELNIQYDASTFDTDPFEPQPDGVGTIFPFWVPRPHSGESPPSSRAAHPSASDPGYVELPYTLPQDSTLFLLLQEPSPEIWIQKLDWVAAHGGMVLLNVHPDYVRFDETAKPFRDFPYHHYREFLEHVRRQYAGLYWQPLAREVAEFCSAFQPMRPAASQRRVAMISHSVYQRDNRVMRYAEALAARGDEVDIFALKGEPRLASAEKIGPVNVHRIADRFKKDQETRREYLLPLLKFWFLASAHLTWRHFRRRYDLVHVHNMPDFLVFAAWFPRLTGAKVILDIHDIMPEFYASKFHMDENTPGVRMLKIMERAAARFASHVIISNHLWLKTFVARSAPESKCSVFINNVNRDHFYPRHHVGNGGKFIFQFPGGLQWHQGLDVAIQAMPLVLKEVPDAEFHIYGEGNMKDQWMALTRNLGLTGVVRFFEPRPVSQIADIMSHADVGVVPKRADSFGNEAYSTKIMEFLALGVPVVVSSTRIDRYYFNDSVVRFFESGNPEAMAAAMIEVLRRPDLRRRLVANGLHYARYNSWESRKAGYLDLVDALIENRPARQPPSDQCGPSPDDAHAGQLPVPNGEIQRLTAK
jgi:glycosyltransferase involved in cell wall biosynthesis